MRNHHSDATLPNQTDLRNCSSSLLPSAGSAKESTGGSPMQGPQPKKKSGLGFSLLIAFFALVLLGGIGMLLHQGVEAFHLFTGKDMPAQEVMEKFFS